MFSLLVALAVGFVALGQYGVSKKPTPFWIGLAFLCFGLFSAFDSLSAPGLVRGGRPLLAQLPGTSAWFQQLSYAALAVLLVAAIALPWPSGERPDHRWAVRGAIAIPAICALLGVLVLAAEPALPPLIANEAWTPLDVAWSSLLLLVIAGGGI
ncbi:MAG: hypothetical protein HY689_06660 [Chloroflexi bacterium]|nr:hypothetical protein [Chloroflexota bacterium]